MPIIRSDDMQVAYDAERALGGRRYPRQMPNVRGIPSNPALRESIHLKISNKRILWVRENGDEIIFKDGTHIEVSKDGTSARVVYIPNIIPASDV